jgi:hypothetical protein
MADRLLKGTPVLIMRRGVYPNHAEIADIVARLNKTHVVRTEYLNDARFCVTAQRRIAK